jgi:hypothetical protein
VRTWEIDNFPADDWIGGPMGGGPVKVVELGPVLDLLEEWTQGSLAGGMQRVAKASLALLDEHRPDRD